MIVKTKSVEIRQPSRQCAFEDTNFIWLVKQRVLFLLYDDSVWVMANWPFLFIYLLYIESGRTWVKSSGLRHPALVGGSDLLRDKSKLCRVSL